VQKPSAILFVLVLITKNVFAQSDVQLKFDAPAVHFTQSIPLGNGRLGAMVFGDVNKERIAPLFIETGVKKSCKNCQGRILFWR